MIHRRSHARSERSEPAGPDGPNDPDAAAGPGRRPGLRPVPGVGTVADPHIRWIRARIVRTVARLAAAGWAVVAVAATGGLHWLRDLRWPVAVPVGALLALAPVALLLVRAVLANPFSVGWLRARRQANRRLELGRAGDLAPPLGRSVTAVAAAWDRGDPPRPVVDLYRGPGGVLVARYRGEGWLSVLSRLHDGRILITDAASPVPHSRLVVNLVPDGDLGSLLARHGEVAAALGAGGQPGQQTDPSLYLELRAVEEAALAQLGPRLAPFFNPFPPARRLRFLGPLPPAALLALAGVPPGAAAGVGRQGPGGYR